MFASIYRRVGTLLVFSCGLLLATQIGCDTTDADPEEMQEVTDPDGGTTPDDADGTTSPDGLVDGTTQSVSVHPFVGIDPAVTFEPPSDVNWHVLAGALSLSDLAATPEPVSPFPVPVPGFGKLFEELSSEAQAALTAALDTAASGSPMSIFLPPLDSSGVLTTGIGFALQSTPTDWYAFGFPALEITGDPFAPIAVSPDGPVITLNRETFDQLTLAFEPIVAGAASGGFQPLDPALEDELTMLAEDLESFLGSIRSDDSSDGVISARQELSLTIPGNVDFEIPDQHVVARVTFDLVQTDSGDRWVGGLGADVTLTDLTTGELMQSYEFELAYGQQQVENLPVISLEPGDGNAEGASALAGEWLASLTIGDLSGAGLTLPLATPQPSVGMKTGSAGDSASAMDARMRQATGLMLSTITGVGTRDPRAQVVSTEGDTLYMRLRFSESGLWTDMSFAVGSSEQTPEAEQFESLVSMLGLLEAQLGVNLPPVELRTTMADSGYVRFDVVATDLVEALLASFGSQGGSDDSIGADIGALPDISALVIGGLLTDDVIEGSAIILLLAQDIRFERQ